jgi:hypothetical protein
MFHVERAARALVLGAFLVSAAASARMELGGLSPAPQGAPAGGADVGANEGTPQKTPATPAKRKRKAATSRTSSDKSGAKKSSSKATASKDKAAAGTAKKKSSSKTSAKRDPRAVGLGRSCTKRADCGSKAQVCLHQQDQRGKKLARGFCALPCAGLEQGLTKTRPGFPARDPVTTKKILQKPPPARCPAKFKCLTKGGNVPIDMCVRE